MENRQIWLLSIVCTALLINSINAGTTGKPSFDSVDHHENMIEDEHDIKPAKMSIPKKPLYLDENLNKMLPDLLEKKKNDTLRKLDTIMRSTIASSTKKAVDVEKKPTLPMADDPRFNKMLPEKNSQKPSNNKDAKKDPESDSDYDYDDDTYNDFYDHLYDESSAENNTNTKPITVTTPKPKKEVKLKPIKGDDKDIPVANKKNEAKDDYEDEEEEDDGDDDNEDENIYSNKVNSCPRDCICDRNLNSDKVATCSRLDAGVQKFGSDITDLVVVDVAPKYPIVLGPSFFVKIGLKNLTSLKISNCTLEMLHATAFHGLNDLFSVNLTNVGITQIDPDTFASNNRLRLLTISGNNLSSMTAKHTRTKYLIKSNSIEELDLSHNNFKEIQAEAFMNLPNIVYINLASNGLSTLPENLFDQVETIEDLDLSYNRIAFLPKEIFKRTALARLDLKYNDIVGDLSFGTADLQELDLSYCSIKNVHNHMFAKMNGLLTLMLKGNGISKIQPDSFTSLNFLRHIDLSFNNLEHLSSMLFYKNPNLDVIRLNDNDKLSELPPDGFQSSTDSFTVYLLDISNCAISSLGLNTFSQMPHITTLKLSWNNINNMNRDTFANLKQLTEIDLSNNLIVKLDDKIFKNNKQLSKINLSGNPIKGISTKLFETSIRLHELDVSDCELENVLEDYYYDNQQNITTAFFDTLRLFNVSYNKIKKITKKHIRLFKNLKTFAFEENPIKCNDDFKTLIKYLTQKGIYSGKVLEKSILEIPFKLPAQTIQGWDVIRQKVCKHENDKLKLKKEQKGTIFDNEMDESDDDDDDIEEDNNQKIKELFVTKKRVPTKEQGKKILDGLKEEEDQNDKDKNNAAEEKDNEDDSYEDEAGEDENDNEEDNDEDNDEDNSKEDSDDDDDDEEYNYDYDEDIDGGSKTKQKAVTKKSETVKTNEGIKNIGIYVDEVELRKETDDKFIIDKLSNDDDDDEEIIIERGHIYYDNYRFLKPLAITVGVFVVLLLLIIKIVSMIVRKRGERYRMAILASKNSIVYQKLSEEINKPSNKNPKVHRYSRINQV